MILKDYSQWSVVRQSPLPLVVKGKESFLSIESYLRIKRVFGGIEGIESTFFTFSTLQLAASLHSSPFFTFSTFSTFST